MQYETKKIAAERTVGVWIPIKGFDSHNKAVEYAKELNQPRYYWVVKRPNGQYTALNAKRRTEQEAIDAENPCTIVSHHKTPEECTREMERLNKKEEPKFYWVLKQDDRFYWDSTPYTEVEAKKQFFKSTLVLGFKTTTACKEARDKIEKEFMNPKYYWVSKWNDTSYTYDSTARTKEEQQKYMNTKGKGIPFSAWDTPAKAREERDRLASKKEEPGFYWVFLEENGTANCTLDSYTQRTFRDKWPNKTAIASSKNQQEAMTIYRQYNTDLIRSGTPRNEMKQAPVPKAFKPQPMVVAKKKLLLI